MTTYKRLKKRCARLTPAGRLYLELLNKLADYSVEEIKFLCGKSKEKERLTRVMKKHK